MKEDFIYLTYEEAIGIMIGIDALKNDNPYFKDEIATSYTNYIIAKTLENIKEEMEAKGLIKKLISKKNKYKISSSLFNYLTRLIGFNVKNKTDLDKLLDIAAIEMEKDKENYPLETKDLIDLYENFDTKYSLKKHILSLFK